MNKVNWIEDTKENREKITCGYKWITVYNYCTDTREVQIGRPIFSFRGFYYWEHDFDSDPDYTVIAFAEIEYPLPYETEEERELKRAKKFINDFCKREYGSEADFTNLKEIPILYSTYGDDEMIEVQVNVNLVDYEIVFLKRDNGNNEEEYSVYKVDGYATLKEMNDYVLEWMDFNDLYAEYEFDEE